MSESAPAAPPAEPSVYSTYFLELKVEGIRCFDEEQTLRMSEGGRPARWTLLLGDNGTGKTTLLQVIASLRPEPRALSFDHGSVPSLTVASWPGPFWRPWVRPPADLVGGRELELRVALSRSLDSEPVHHDSLRHQYLHPDAGSPNRALGPESNLEHFPQCDTLVVAYGALRRLRGGPTLATNVGESPEIASLFSSDALLIPAEEWFLQRHLAELSLPAGSREQLRARMASLRARQVLLSVLPEIDGLTVVISDPTAGGAELHAMTQYGSVRVSDLGLGYQTTLAWVTDLAARMTAHYPHSANPLAEPAVVLIDEIDLHLHPRWQRSLLRGLSEQFPNVQWIATSHSPLVVQNAPPGTQVVVLRREGDHVVIDNSDIEVRNWRLDQILTSDLFGLPSARAKDLDPLLEEQERLLSKPELTPAEETRLEEIDKRVNELPSGETPHEMEAMRIIRDAARTMPKGSP